MANRRSDGGHDPPPLDRFRTAQDDPDAGFETALEEIRTGGKRGHWIWYVFPQLAGLGGSSVSQFYAVGGAGEAMRYLRDPVLRSRLLAISTAVAAQLQGGRGLSLRALMGSNVDALKLVSSLTLFGRVARQLHAAQGLEVYERLASVAEEVLGVAEAQGYPPCGYTLEQLRE
jgi:uncharacterized protein (DUF1810 family)